MEKTAKLKDGSSVIIRPLTEKDVDISFDFFKRLSPEERLYLRVDVSNRDIVARRLRNVGAINAKRICAEFEGKIVADAALELRPHGWEKHLADFRLIVSDGFQRKGLGMLMAEELYSMALSEQVEEMLVELMAPQTNAKKIFERLGFQQDVVLKDFVKDINGKKQDLIIMRCNLNKIWDKLESYFGEIENKHMHEN